MKTQFASWLDSVRMLSTEHLLRSQKELRAVEAGTGLGLTEDMLAAVEKELARRSALQASIKRPIPRIERA